MLEQNNNARDRLIVTKWHKAGYTGKGINIAVLDDSGRIRQHSKDKVILPFDNHKNKSGHKTNVVDVILEIAPEVTIYAFNYFSNNKEEISDWLKENKEKIDLINCSFDSPFKEDFEPITKLDIPIFASAGNRGNTNISFPGEHNETISIGAYNHYLDKIASYSSYPPDITAFTDIYVMGVRPFNYNGTSTASPVACCMTALYLQYLKEHNIKWTKEDVRRFVIENSHINLIREDQQHKAGDGLFILPKLEELEKEVNEMSINKPNKIVLHHSATDDTHIKNFDGIKNHHINVNGWADVGYHYVVEKVNGKYVTIKGREENVAGVHCPGQNSQSIGICLVGDFRKGNPPKEQLEEVTKLIKDIRSRHGELPLYKHSDFRPTECPVFDLELIIDLMEADNNMSWEEKQGLEYLDNLVKKGIIESPDYWKEKMLEPMPVWAILSLIDRITDK